MAKESRGGRRSLISPWDMYKRIESADDKAHRDKNGFLFGTRKTEKEIESEVDSKVRDLLKSEYGVNMYAMQNKLLNSQNNSIGLQTSLNADSKKLNANVYEDMRELGANGRKSVDVSLGLNANSPYNPTADIIYTLKNGSIIRHEIVNANGMSFDYNAGKGNYIVTNGTATRTFNSIKTAYTFAKRKAAK